jgi:hypothetical protein
MTRCSPSRSFTTPWRASKSTSSRAQDSRHHPQGRCQNRTRTPA